jgi:pimeloyl-ACP methyl ester carboxylesterase
MTYRDLYVSAADGLKLYARDYGASTSPHLPVVCLPGLSRNSSDFDDLARAFAQDEAQPRRVLALDYRGRGRSDYDKNWRHYDVKIELNDVLQILIAASIEEALFIGTSRGGLISMALSAVRPTLLRGLVLNDIGPVIEARGLMRIKSYVGKLPKPKDFTQGAHLLSHIFSAQFPQLTHAQWERWARSTWRQQQDTQEEQGALVLDYDPNIMRPFAKLDLEQPLPPLWPLFEGLKNIPLLVLRGEHSDLLSVETLNEMQKRHPDCSTITVAHQGHAPLLDDQKLIENIQDFARKAEATKMKAVL